MVQSPHAPLPLPPPQLPPTFLIFVMAVALLPVFLCCQRCGLPVVPPADWLRDRKLARVLTCCSDFILDADSPCCVSMSGPLPCELRWCFLRSDYHRFQMSDNRPIVSLRHSLVAGQNSRQICVIRSSLSVLLCPVAGCL